jgi:PAS domain S-box-containing protein
MSTSGRGFGRNRGQEPHNVGAEPNAWIETTLESVPPDGDVAPDSAIYRTLFECTAEAAALSLNGIHILVNPAYARLFGHDHPDEMRGTRILDYMAPESYEEVRRNIEVRARGGPAPASYDLTGLRKDGTRLFVEVNVVTISIGGKPYTLATMRDVTELWNAQAALRVSDEKFAKAFASSNQGISIARLSDGLYVDVNGIFLENTGFKREEIVGKRRDEVGLWANPEELQRYKELLATEGRVRNLMAEYRSKSGDLLTAVLSCEVIEIDGVEHTLNFIQDVTDREKAIRELERTQAELERRVAERTAQLEITNQELESFSYSVSHDLRGPLRTLDGFSRILLMDVADRLDDEAKHYLVRICEAANRMGRLVDDLLKLSRLSKAELKYQDVDISAVSGDIVRKLRENEPERRVELIVTPRLRVRADADLLYSVMDNLLNNAWKYTSKRDVAHIEVGSLLRDGRKTFFVRDDGAGFNMSYAGRLFGAFQRLHTEDEFPGTGIGLATVQRIIRRHGGDVWAEAEPDKGATFYFTVGTALHTRAPAEPGRQRDSSGGT